MKNKITKYGIVCLILLSAGCAALKNIAELEDLTSPNKPIITGVTNNTVYAGGVTINAVAVEGVYHKAWIDTVSFELGNFYEEHGTHNLYVKAIKRSNNEFSTANITFTIDTNYPPAPTVTGIENNAVYTESIRISVTEEAGITYEATLDDSAYVFGDLISAAGVHQLIIISTRETNGFTKTTTFNFTIDASLPDAPEVTGIANNGIYGTSVTPVIEQLSGMTYQCTLNDNAYTSGTEITDSGSYTLVVTKTKTANGLTNSSTLVFVIDKIGPVAGNSGTITAANIQTTSLTINWSKAADTVSAEASLAYLPYFSIANNISSISTVLANGTAIGTYSTNINSKAVTGLSENTSYYFNVLVKDEIGNISAYTGLQQTTADETAPGVPSVTGTAITNDNTPVWDWADVSAATQYRYSFTDGSGWTVTTSSEYTPASPLSDATYRLYVQTGDASDNWSNSGSYSIQIDTVAPSGYSASINQSSINNSNKTALSFTFASAETGASYSYSINDTNGGTAAITGSGTVSTTTDTISSIDVSGLDDDTLTLTVYLTDAAGNQGSNSTDTVNKDVVAPSGYSASINQSLIDSSNKTALSFTFASAETGASYSYSINDTNGGTAAITGSGTISTTTDTISSLDVSGLDDEELTLTVYLTDAAGNQGSNTTDTVNKDATAPSGYSASINQSLIDNSNETALSFTFASAETGASYSYSIDDTNGGTSAITGSGTISTSTDTISGIDVSSLDDDTLTLTVYLTDTAGNQGSNSTDTVNKDVTAPSGYSASIDQSSINNSNKTALSFTFASAETGANYNYSIDDTNGSTSAITGSGTISTTTDTISSIDVSDLDDDTLTLTVYLTDAAGNQGSNATDTVGKDVVTPSGYSVSIVQSSLNASNETSMSFTFASAETGAGYNYSIDDTNSNTSAVTGTGTIANSTATISGINASSLDNETLTITVYLTDTAGNQGSNTTDTVEKEKRWSYVGAANFTSGGIEFSSIAFDSSNNPYVGYSDTHNTDSSLRRANVKKFNGTSWEDVGSAGFTPDGAYGGKLELDLNTPYYGFADASVSNKASVMKYDGSSWTNIGSAGFTTENALINVMALDSSGTPYVVFRTGVSPYKATVMKYDGSNWVVVGNAEFSSDSAYNLTIAIDSSDTVYVAYRDKAASYKATVMKFNGTSWVLVGSQGFSAGSASYSSLAIDSAGTVYIAFQDAGNSYKSTVMKFNGSSWVLVGSAGFSANAISRPILAIDSNDVPILLYSYATDTMMGMNLNMIVMKFNGSTWENLGTTNFVGPASSNNLNHSLNIDSDNTIYISYPSRSGSEKLNVQKYK
jgi:hypothetical protein